MKKTIRILPIMLILSMFLLAGCKDNGIEDYNTGLAAMKKGEYSQAIMQLSTAIRKNKEQPEYYISYGIAMLQLNRQGEALSSFKKAFSFSGEDVENQKRSYRGLGISYYFQNKFDLAEENLRRAIEINVLTDLDLECYAYLGALNDATGDTQEAYEAYKKVLEINNEKFSAIIGKYKAEIALNMKKEAKKTLKEGLKCIPTTAEDQYLYAKLQFYAEDYKGAQEELRKAADSYEEAYIFLGQIKMTENNFDDAIKCFETYIFKTGDEKNLTICGMMARCYISEFEYKKAKEWVQKGMEIEANDSELQSIRYHEIIIYENLNKYQKAYSLAQEYSKIYPEDERFSGAVSHLKNMVKKRR